MVRDRIEEKLAAVFDPRHLEVVNESGNHNVPDGSESHFKVVIVSEQFENERLINRHRRVNAALAEELAGSVHALAIHAYTPLDWQKRFGNAPMSPPCRGGDGAQRARRDPLG